MSDDFDDSHDPNAAGLAGPPVVPVFMRAYALCRDGFVHAVRSVEGHLAHPFGNVEMGIPGQAQDPSREHVVEVTGAVCHPGYIVDNKGNVAPAGTRTTALPIDAPAYHDSHVVPPIPVTETAEIVGRPPMPNAPGTPGPLSTDAKVEGRSNEDPASLPENHDADHGVQEHHEHPVHDEPAPEHHDDEHHD